MPEGVTRCFVWKRCTPSHDIHGVCEILVELRGTTVLIILQTCCSTVELGAYK